MLRPATVLRDPVHGDIELTREELQLIDTLAFQRLRGIKQLGTANLVYPGATHTRFEHSIGTVHMLDRLLDAVNRNAERDPSGCQRVSDEERRILRFGALLHDVPHIPFGHNIEDQTGLLERHDVPRRYVELLEQSELGEVLDRLGVRGEVLGVLASGGTGARDVPPFWKQVLSDTVDADLMDYLRRDAWHTGLELHYDDRVRAGFRVDRASQRLYVDCEKDGMLREDTVSELVRMLEIRFHFSERVYYHHAKVAAGALIARMVELGLRSGAIAQHSLQKATDESLLFLLERAELSDLMETSRLRRFLTRFRRRQLPKRLVVLPAYANAGLQDELVERFFRPGDPGPRNEWERDVEEAAQRLLGRPVDVILYCPARRMQLKEARTLVRFPGQAGALTPLEDHVQDLPRLRDLRDQYPRLWKLYVFTSETDRAARRKLQELCLERLPGSAVNVLRC